MTFVPVTTATTAGSTAAIAAALKRQRELRREEEEMTGYKSEDLEGWEFKIVRAATRKFKDPKALRQVCAEEAEAGWEMLEKFDDQRIRFKRRVERREGDAHLETDPYRTQFGVSGQMQELYVAGALLLGLGLLGLAVFLFLDLAG